MEEGTVEVEVRWGSRPAHGQQQVKKCVRALLLPLCFLSLHAPWGWS